MQAISLHDRIDAFHKLGSFFEYFCGENTKASFVVSEKHYTKIGELINNIYQYNPWFTQRFVLDSIKAWAKLLEKNNLETWSGKYKLQDINNTPKTIGTVLAGNIPLVGFQDFLCVLISGNIIQAKLSSKDNMLFPAIIDVLYEINPLLKNYISIVDRLQVFDAIIATGSNNTSRYFDFYFGKYPHIIRKNRNSVAVLSGNETIEKLKLLGNDIFQYFGLGCRNVSKVYIPRNFKIERLFKAFDDFRNLQEHVKYMNNYDYYKSIYLLNKINFSENGYLILKEDTSMHSPPSVVFYEYYDNIDNVKAFLQLNENQIQCIVSDIEKLKNTVQLGKAQSPGLDDYADNVDVLEFIQTLN